MLCVRSNLVTHILNENGPKACRILYNAHIANSPIAVPNSVPSESLAKLIQGGLSHFSQLSQLSQYRRIDGSESAEL